MTTTWPGKGIWSSRFCRPTRWRSSGSWEMNGNAIKKPSNVFQHIQHPAYFVSYSCCFPRRMSNSPPIHPKSKISQDIPGPTMRIHGANGPANCPPLLPRLHQQEAALSAPRTPMFGPSVHPKFSKMTLNVLQGFHFEHEWSMMLALSCTCISCTVWSCMHSSIAKAWNTTPPQTA